MPDDDTDADADICRVVDATGAALQSEGWAPTRIVLVAEVLTEEGNRMLIHGCTNDLPTWDIMGLLHHALIVTDQAAQREEVGGD